jgi:hypothetical protein
MIPQQIEIGGDGGGQDEDDGGGLNGIELNADS